MKRKIIEINEDKCNGCGLCVNACHEGAIKMVNGKAKLISDEYCDGLGDCLPACPTEAINIIEREAKDYDEELVKLKMEEKSQSSPLPCGCPGTMAKTIERKTIDKQVKIKEEKNESFDSMLKQWPVQMKLINSRAEYLKNADILIAADCTAYAYGNFHNDFINGKITIIACPKLDDNDYNKEKIIDILKNNTIKSITVVRMRVPCCGGIVSAVREAMLEAQVIVPYSEVTITTDGKILK